MQCHARFHPLLFTRCKNTIYERSYDRSKSHANSKHYASWYMIMTSRRMYKTKWARGWPKDPRRVWNNLSARDLYSTCDSIALICSACNLENVLKHIIPCQSHLLTRWRAIPENQLIELETIVIESRDHITIRLSISGTINMVPCSS